jgi:Protein of unknown function (DUF1501)
VHHRPLARTAIITPDAHESLRVLKSLACSRLSISTSTIATRVARLGYNIVEDPVDVHDLHATILHLMGLDHTKLTYKFQGREFRLTDVHGNLVTKLLA